MAVGGVGNNGARTEQMRTDQRRAEEARTQEQKQANQTNREVADTRKATAQGRGENMDLTA